MKALSIQQPWAWLIVNGYKDVENRDWPTKIRGRFLVHAGKRLDVAADRWLRGARGPLPGVVIPATFDLGGIVGSASVVDCVSKHESLWFEGRFGFVLRDATPCSLVPLRGQLGFFDVPDSLLSDDVPAPFDGGAT